MRRVIPLIAALGLGAGLLLLGADPAEPPSSTEAARPISHPRTPAWIPSAPAPSTEAEPQGLPAQAEPGQSGEWAEGLSDEAWAERHELMHDQAWEDLVQELARQGHDPERFLDAMEAASVERWWAEEEEPRPPSGGPFPSSGP